MPGLEGKILDRYQLQRLIGRGGMADVYEGHGIGDGRTAAVKVFKGNDEDLLRRFIREARLMSSLHNEHLLPIYASGDAVIDGYPRYFIVMPLMKGGTLRARIRRAPLSLEEACRCLRDIADALDYIHRQGVIHRDIKSSNVLLDDAGNCYLADFGIARDVSESTQLTTTGSVLGTVDYVAPELFLPGHKADDRSDLYSLGVLLFEMVTGQLPFAAESQLAVVSMHLNHPPPTPSKIDPHLSSSIDLVILRAMDKNPDMRYPSAIALAEAFDRAIHRTQEAAGEDHAPQIISIGGAQQLVLSPVPSTRAPSAPLSNVAKAAPSHRTHLRRPNWMRPSPLSNSTETAAYVPRRPEATPDPAPISRREARLARRSRYARRRFRIALFIALFFLAIIAVFSIYAVLSQSRSNHTPGGGSTLPTRGATTSSVTQAPTATPNLTATAQANARATVTAQASATAAAIAHATAVAEANAAATAGVIQTATSGAPAYQDALNNPNNPSTQTAAWDTGSQCSFSKDGYHVQAGAFPNLKGCRETGYTYLNAAISVHVTILSGHSGGLFFRLSTDPVGEYDGYLFEIDTQGHYKISTINNGSVSALQDWTFSAALKQGYAVTNTLQVIMQDNEYLFYNNGNFLTVITDSTYSSAGNIGFVATTSGGGNADVLYSDLSVYNH
jgi:serine/threonine protein kinase